MKFSLKTVRKSTLIREFRFLYSYFALHFYTDYKEKQKIPRFDRERFITKMGALFLRLINKLRTVMYLSYNVLVESI